MSVKPIPLQGSYITTFLRCADRETLLQYCSCFRYVLGPVAFDEFFYAAIRTRNGIILLEGIEEITPEQGITVLGVWT